MRRVLHVAAMALLLAVAPPTRGGAHTCASPYQVRPGQPMRLDIGVGAELDGVTRVDVQVPDGFRLDRVLDTGGWRSRREGPMISFTGGRIAPFSCAFFTVLGTPTRTATLVFPLAVGTETGAVQKHLDGGSGAQLVYAGTQPTADDLRLADRGGAGNRVRGAAVPAAVVLALGAAVFGVRRARRRATGRAGRR